MTESQTLHAITVLGRDRPGIIAETTGRLSGLGLNLEDSTMTLLRGHFAMMLLSSGAVAASAVEEALSSLSADGALTVSVREIEIEVDDATPVAGEPWILSVHGGDRPGIVAAILAEVAAVGGNITDLTTRLSGALYVVIAEIDLPGHADAASLSAAIAQVASGLGVEATLRAARADDL